VVACSDIYAPAPRAVAENCSFEHPALGSSYCIPDFVDSCWSSRATRTYLYIYTACIPTELSSSKKSVVRRSDGSLNRTVLPLAPTYVCNTDSSAQVVKRRITGWSMCPASAQPGGMHCRDSQPSQQLSVSFFCMLRSIAMMPFYSRHL
jgi:hypothetical protein